MVKELRSCGCVIVNLEKSEIWAGCWRGFHAQGTTCLQVGSLIRVFTKAPRVLLIAKYKTFLLGPCWFGLCIVLEVWIIRIWVYQTSECVSIFSVCFLFINRSLLFHPVSVWFCLMPWLCVCIWKGVLWPQYSAWDQVWRGGVLHKSVTKTHLKCFASKMLVPSVAAYW